jgi:signal transduction histidine kinase
MTAALPDWMLLHFQVDPLKVWTSPQVVGEKLQQTLRKQPIELAIDNVDAARRDRLQELRTAYPARAFLAVLRSNGLDFETVNRDAQQTIQELNINPANGLNQQTGNTFAPLQTPSNSAATGNSTTSNSGGIDLNNDQGKRFASVSRGKIEGRGAYQNDGRNYTPPEGIELYRKFGSKLREYEALQQAQQGLKDLPDRALGENRLEAVQRELDELRRGLQPVEVELTSMQPIWLPGPENPKHLLMVRPARVGDNLAYQGMLLDWPRLQEIMKAEIDYLLPEARFMPLAKNNPERLEREILALPVELDAGPPPEPDGLENVELAEPDRPAWTPLRIGLSLAWAAALVALVAVGLGGWSLLDLSERRIRFVSAVTHELRTPLTTLRLYLDLLNSGLVSEPTQREEYVRTLSGEADRLHRLIGNVLDFARLEKTRPAIDLQPIGAAELLDTLKQTWQERCSTSSKRLEIECALPADAIVRSDRNLVEQILGNLIDNARKYSQDAADPVITLRAGRAGGTFFVEVEDRGPGIAKRERRSIFRPFRRGHDADVKAGGVGLGLALATRWASFLNGRLSVRAGAGDRGACFRLELPG